MKVLLISDIEGAGRLGDVVEVKDGYARNYLLSRGLAVVPTEASLRSIAQERVKRAEQRIKERDRLENAAKAVDGAEAVVVANSNEAGVLFGSVTASQIAANLRQQGFEVADEVVELAEHIKHTGTHTVKLRYSEDLTVTVNVVVVPAVPGAQHGEAQREQEDEPVNETS